MSFQRFTWGFNFSSRCIEGIVVNLGFAFDAFVYRPKPIQGEFQFIETRAGTIRALDVGQRDGITVVLTPDGPCTIEHFSALVEKLKPEYRVVVFDMPGFGSSKPISDYDHSPARAVECIEDLFNHLKIEQAVLNFTCVNGFYALSFAKQFPKRVKGIILGQTPDFSTMSDWVDRVIPKVLRFPLIGQIISWLNRYKLAKIWFKIALPKGHDIEPWVEKSISNLKDGGCNCLASLVQGMLGSTDSQFIGVRVPVISQWGTLDRSHENNSAQSLKNIVKAEIEILPSCGHFPNLESMESVLSALKRLL